MKKILITGKGSYIGDAVKTYLDADKSNYQVDVLDTLNLDVKPELFQGYDVVFNVAGIAHVKETDENRHLYDLVNRELSIKIATAAKSAGVSQLILLSSMSVYGQTTGHITKQTEPKPSTAYGISKYEADKAIMLLEEESFKVAILRPPMVYGKNCKGNYQSLRKLALKTPIFPKINNQRSMVYIGNLCEFVKKVVDTQSSGLFFPQNAQYVCTEDMVRQIAKANGKSIWFMVGFSWLIRSAFSPNLVKKVFGDLTYEAVDTIDQYSFEESITLSETE